jgi:hypothetical protein
MPPDLGESRPVLSVIDLEWLGESLFGQVAYQIYSLHHVALSGQLDQSQGYITTSSLTSCPCELMPMLYNLSVHLPKRVCLRNTK